MIEISRNDIDSMLLDSLPKENREQPLEAKDNTWITGAGQQEHDKEYDERNILYTVLLKSYIASYEEKDKEKRKYKKVFFYVAIGILCLIIIACLLLIGMVIGKEKGNYADIGAVAGSVVGIITALIAIPKVIAEHLFPVNEESNMIDMVKNMQDNDSNIRNVIYRNGDNERNQEKDA